MAIGSETWLRGPAIWRDEMAFAVGVEAQAMSMTVAADQSVQINGVPLLAFLLSGGCDGAQVRAFTAFRADLGMPLGRQARAVRRASLRTLNRRAA